jgi:hypothetical protein
MIDPSKQPVNVQVKFSDGELVEFKGVVDKIGELLRRAKRLWVSNLTYRFDGDHDTLLERLDNNPKPMTVVITLEEDKK